MGNLVLFLVTVFVLATCVNVDGQSTVCPITCPKDAVLDEPTCQCVSQNSTASPTFKCPEIKCPFSQCRIYKKDIQGCPTCVCLVRCPKPICPKKCGGGIEELTDNDGCPFCRCKQPPRCKNFSCKLYCPYGYEKDKIGCDICQCKPCGVPCTTKCSFGYLVDLNGCTICECKPKPDCGPVCGNFCPYGVLSEDGCPSCQCALHPDCKPVCDNFCQDGRVIDDKGCPTCECLPSP